MKPLFVIAVVLAPWVSVAACSSSGDGAKDSGTGAGGRGGGDMVGVPGGPFMMGCNSADKQCNADESPYHSVDLSDFSIDRTEVTEADYLACSAAGVCPAVQGMQADAIPVHDVAWTTAAAYCAWAGKRLPTEAEWEKAARGTDGRIYPWGNAAPTCELANFGTCAGALVAVGGRNAGASPYGALDMVGNAAEWVADHYAADYYAESPTSNPQGPSAGADYVDRGGWYRSSPAQVRSSFREANSADTALAYLGFRCAR